MDKIYNVDLFFIQLIYLPFKDAINICQLNRKFYNYSVSSKYNNKWKAIIDYTFSNVYNYIDKLNKIWYDLKYNQNIYDYIIYTNLVNYLDPLLS